MISQQRAVLFPAFKARILLPIYPIKTQASSESESIHYVGQEQYNLLSSYVFPKKTGKKNKGILKKTDLWQ